MEVKKYYLAYGSNLNLTQMKHRCPKAKPIGTINLNGYRLVYKGSAEGYSYLTIEKSEDDFVPLGVFEVSLLDIFKLDKYEGYPDLYSKHYIPIKINGELLDALIYVMNEEFDYNVPSDEYIDICMEGYDDFNFDKNILEKALINTTQNIYKKVK